MHHHATKAKSTPTAEHPKAESRPNFFRRFVARLTWNDPLPIIASSLVVAFVIGIVWQVNFGPLTHLRKPVPSTPQQIVLSPAEMLAARTALKQISVSFLYVRQGLDKWRDLLENWQYQIQTNGPDDFSKNAGDIYTGISLAGFLGMSNAVSGMDMRKYPDIAEIVKNDSPDCLGKPMAFYNEVKRIRDHKGADITFTLINNTKMSDMRAALPECMTWMAIRANAIAKVETKYQVSQ